MSQLSSRKRRIVVSLLSFTVIAQQSLLPVMASSISGAGSVTGDSVIHNTNGTNIYNIAPQAFNKDTGYRRYENFNLDKGDIANLIYQWYGTKNGKTGTYDIENFVNFVNNRINVNGIVNTMKDGNFYNGNAIFVSPNGMVIGKSGLLNVGSLTVVTPTQDKFNQFIGNPDVSAPILAHPGTPEYESTLGSLGGGNVTVNGNVLARHDVTIDAGDVALVKGQIVTGVKSDAIFTPDGDYKVKPNDEGRGTDSNGFASQNRV